MSVTDTNNEPQNVEFPLTSQGEPEEMKVFDLNKIFQMNLTYNFDILKNLITSLIQNQKNFQNQINDLKSVLLSGGQISPEALKKIMENKQTDQQKTNIENVNKPHKAGTVRAPRSDVKLEVSIENDDTTNKIIKKINGMEDTVLDLYEIVPPLKKKCDSNTERLTTLENKYEKKINEIQEKIDEFDNLIEKHTNKLKDMEVKMQDFNIVELLKAGAGGDGGDVNMTLGLISNLEKKVMTKIKYTDERITKTDSLNFKMNKDIQNIKNVQDLNNRNIENLKKKVENLDERINSLEQNIQNQITDIDNKFTEKITLLQKNSEEHLENIKNLKSKSDNSNISKKKDTLSINDIKKLIDVENLDLENNEKFKDMCDHVSDLDKMMKNLHNSLGLEQVKSDISVLKSGVANCALSQDCKDTKDKTEELQRQLNYLREQLEDFMSNQTDHEDIQNLKRKLESINSKIHELDITQQDINTKFNQNSEFKRLNLDPSKFLEIKIFEDFKTQVIKEFTSVNENFTHLRRLVDNILDSLKNKVSYKDVKALEEDLLTKMEDLKLTFSKKFAERVETVKNIKYLDQQIKHIINVYIKKGDKGDNWLLAKKPLNANLCASCESYIGDLKENNTYIPWNRYPNKEGEKLYRLGNGFSKMLQMIQVDENDKKNTGIQNDLNNNNNSATKTEGNNNTERNFNKVDNKKNLPRIRNNSKMNQTKSYFNTNSGLNTMPEVEQVNENTSVDKVNIVEPHEEKEEEVNSPKITKIYRLNKDSN